MNPDETQQAQQAEMAHYSAGVEGVDFTAADDQTPTQQEEDQK